MLQPESIMPARKQHKCPWDIMRLRLPPGTFVRMQKVLKVWETRTELIRIALEQELTRREAEKKRTK